MNKLQKFFKGIILLMKKPYLINNVLNTDDSFKSDFKVQFPNSNPLKQISLSSIGDLSSIQTVTPYSFLGGSSLITDFLLLKLVCQRTKASDYLEIGTWRGESVSNVSDIVENCFTLNLSDEQLKQLNLSQDYVNAHRFFSKEKENITHLFGDSRSFDFEELNKKFDVIFIDGDHHTDAVEFDTKRMLPFLKSDDSIMVWHDAKSDTETPRYEVLLGIYKGIPKEKHQHIYLVENTLCAVYLPNMELSSELKPHLKPNHFFEVDIRMKPVE